MKLRNDPYQVFRYSKTPAGLYARQKWLGEAERSQWKIDYQETVSDLLAAQSADGSWRQEQIATIKHWNTFLAIHALKNKGLLLEKKATKSVASVPLFFLLKY